MLISGAVTNDVLPDMFTSQLPNELKILKPSSKFVAMGYGSLPSSGRQLHLTNCTAFNSFYDLFIYILL
jgi:hypothetical protein